MIQFYDTNALLYVCNTKEVKNFLISNLTLTELENIKQNSKKDLQIKYKARHLIQWLIQNNDKYNIIQYNYQWDKELKKYPMLPDNIDSRIILSAIHAKKQFNDIKFITYDANCFYLAQNLGLKSEYPIIKDETYVGYKQICCSNETELINFYSSFSQKTYNPYKLLPNEYVLVKDLNNTILSVHKYLGINKGYAQILDIPFNSKMFGKIKPKDVYQKMIMDSMHNNTISLVRGPAGTGKSLLSLGFLFDRLEKNKIDRIIIFCNTVATEGSAKLGYYPGSKDQKLLDSQIGNFLVSKIGDKIAVETLIDKGQLILLPMSDIRGFDTSGMKAGVYITQAQNMSIDLMKLALQRIGQDSIVILDGDSNAQVDLGMYGGINNGLRRVSKVFRGSDIYGEITLKNIYRSKIANIAQKM